MTAPPPSALVTDLLADLEASPTPYHAVDRVAGSLRDHGFIEVELAGAFPSAPGRYLATVGGTLIAWVSPDAEASGFGIVGAHTDSPNLRVRSRPDLSSAGWAQVGMEVYGGVLANSWLDRDLGLAGRVVLADGGGERTELFCDGRPLLRIPQLAIHLDREIREKGLLLNPQQHLVPIWSLGDAGDGDLVEFVADGLGVASSDVLSWDLMAFDTQAPSVAGRRNEFVSSARIDNLFSAFCATYALTAVADDMAAGSATNPRIPVIVLYDHEEVGSESATGAAGALLASVLERISASRGVDRVGHLASLASSLVVSADGAHATHPNYVDKHEPNHHIAVNGGVVVKRNANQRYASDAASEAPFRRACAEAGVPVQTYIHRNDLPCGSTIGPITAARLGVPTVDVGAPQLAMHSVRELAGVDDVGHLTDALAAVWRSG